MSVIKTALFLLVLVSMAFGGLYMKKNAAKYTAAQNIAQISPIIIGNSGSVRFPERFPSPEVVFQIQTAARTDDVQALNALLVEHRFYLLPERMQRAN